MSEYLLFKLASKALETGLKTFALENRLDKSWESFAPTEQITRLSWDELQDLNQLTWAEYSLDNGLNDLVEVNGYTYELDELGRTVRVGGELRIEEEARNLSAQRDAGFSDRLPSDDGGHLIAAEFGGSGEWINLAPMDAHTNRWGEYRDLELQLKQYIENGQQVYFDNHIIWEADSYRPVAFDIRYTVDGVASEMRIENPAFYYS